MLDKRCCAAFMDYAVELAKHSNCTKANFGAAVVPTEFVMGGIFVEDLDVKNDIVGIGYNRSLKTLGECECIRADVPSGTRVERCYAIHAEQFAMMDAIAKLALSDSCVPCFNESSFLGAPLDGYSIVLARIDPKTKKELKRSVRGFYCTLCSRMAKFLGLDGIVLRANDGSFYYLNRDEMFESSYEFALGKKVIEFARLS
jgi:hypothetical protein